MLRTLINIAYGLGALAFVFLGISLAVWVASR